MRYDSGIQLAADRAEEPGEPAHSSRLCSGACGSELLAGSPETALAILRSAYAAPEDPCLRLVLEHFRERWLALGRRRYANLGCDLEDAAQTALMRLVCRDKLDTLSDPRRLGAWAYSLFIHAVLDLVRAGRRRNGRPTHVGTSEDHAERTLLDALPDEKPTPEELASYRERLAIVARTGSRLEVTRLKFIEDLPEKEIARRQGLTRACVAAQIKRARKTLRRALQDSA
jgi:RNA polymerase sigma factor (sigma-70 family)